VLLNALGESLDQVTVAIGALSEGTGDGERLSSLEGAVEAVRGEIAASKVYVDAQHAAARASEDRERSHMKRAEKALELAERTEGGEAVDSFEAFGRAYAGVAAEGDDEPVDGVSPVPEGVVPRSASGSMARAQKRR